MREHESADTATISHSVNIFVGDVQNQLVFSGMFSYGIEYR